MCPHRANIVATGRGTCQRLRCDYHGWTSGWTAR
ncbi:MAG: Rieske 2Fe-2S domain-containing protein [Actinomycetota bacterium]|nr:Rieske 2Fe-2S domain-containing protein [Actinomycetota bacterium]